jgi:radical SAM protein with 4Fe4S-binding SPASM domain
MDFELFKKIIDDAALSGMKRIHLYLHGEPMLHPRIIDMIGYIKLKDLAMHLTTNGVPFSTEKIIAILNSGVSSADHFIFSMLGNSKDVHEKIMKRVSHQKVLNNINEFLALREKYHVNGPVIETMFYPMPENQHEIEMYRKNWQRIVDHARTATSISYSFSDYKREAKTIVHRQKTCRLLWERLTVFWNGDVTICAHDVDGDWIIGNLAEKSIKEISKSEQLLYVKKTHLQKQFTQFPFCSECDM